MNRSSRHINRIRVAQQPSQNIIKTFVDHKANYEVKVGIAYPNYINHINVGKKSVLITGISEVVTPGTRRMNGSRIPPSYIHPLPARNG